MTSKYRELCGEGLERVRCQGEKSPGHRML